MPQPFLRCQLVIDYDGRRVSVAGRRVTLPVTKFEKLRILSTNASRVVTYDSLLRRAWGRRGGDPTDPKLVRAVGKSLRRRLGDDATDPAYVRKERAVGC